MDLDVISSSMGKQRDEKDNKLCDCTAYFCVPVILFYIIHVIPPAELIKFKREMLLLHTTVDSDWPIPLIYRKAFLFSRTWAS